MGYVDRASAAEGTALVLVVRGVAAAGARRAPALCPDPLLPRLNREEERR